MTMIVQITDAGPVAPTYEDVLSELQGKFRAIYGDDVNLDNDSADGQWVAVIAAAINDANNAIVSAYSQFSPASASGAGLASVVKVNGITKRSASRSTVDLLVVGQAGTTITAGAVQDANDNRWNLPSTVTIPPSGQVTVTATAADQGAIAAAAGTVTKIATPTYGWQSVTNPAAASPGDAVELDAVLRARQRVSVALPALSVLDSLKGALSNLPGVTRVSGVENDSDAVDANGVPSHSIAMVVEGGDASAIASAILLKKGPGARTYGSTVTTATDAYGTPRSVSWSRVGDVAIAVEVQIKALDGYETKVGLAIQQAIADYINALAIGDDVTRTDLYLPARLNGGSQAAYFKLIDVRIAVKGSVLAASDIPIAFNQAASCSASDVTITVTT